MPHGVQAAQGTAAAESGGGAASAAAAPATVRTTTGTAANERHGSRNAGTAAAASLQGGGGGAAGDGAGARQSRATAALGEGEGGQQRLHSARGGGGNNTTPPMGEDGLRRLDSARGGGDTNTTPPTDVNAAAAPLTEERLVAAATAPIQSRFTARSSTADDVLNLAARQEARRVARCAARATERHQRLRITLWRELAARFKYGTPEELRESGSAMNTQELEAAIASVRSGALGRGSQGSRSGC